MRLKRIDLPKDVESGKLKITDEYEDIHSFVEANLIDRIGDTGKKLHTGRSRNDQVALDMQSVYQRTRLTEIDDLVQESVWKQLLKIMEENTETYHAWIYPSAEGTAGYIWLIM